MCPSEESTYIKASTLHLWQECSSLRESAGPMKVLFLLRLVMKCNTIDMGHGQFAFVCTRGRRQNCKFCSRYATKLCDFALTGAKAGKTCDAPMCDRCAKEILPGKDYCPPHVRYSGRWTLITNNGVAVRSSNPAGPTISTAAWMATWRVGVS